MEVQAPMCVHSVVMRQTKDNSSRLIVHLYSDLNTTAFHALPGDDVPLYALNPFDRCSMESSFARLI